MQAVQDKQSEFENMQAFYNDREQQVATVYAENIENQKVEYKEALHGAKEEFATLLNEKADEIRDLLAAVKDKEMQCTRVSRAGQDKEYEIRRLQDEIELLQVRCTSALTSVPFLNSYFIFMKLLFIG